MAGISFSRPILGQAARAQLASIACLRWQLLVNSLRTIRGRVELVSRIAIGLAFVFFGLGGGLGFAIGAYFFVSHGYVESLAVLLWVAFAVWQLFPIVASAFSENAESSNLLRFPLPYSSYFLVRLTYGALDPAAIMGSLWLFGILAGVTLAGHGLFLWAQSVLVIFALFNVLLSQMIFSWIERWLAQRRTREILTLVFFLFMISFQLIGPLASHFGRKSHSQMPHLIEVALPIERALPPGLAAAVLARVSSGSLPAGLGFLAALCGYVVAVVALLDLRLRAQYRGENLSEAVVASASPHQSLRLGWNIPGVAAPVAAVVEKEVRYLVRSGGQTLLTFLMPIFALLLFRFGAMNTRHLLGDLPNRAFPGVVGYTLMMLNNLAYNNFGGDASGIQFFFTSPVSFRHIVLGKNLTHAAIIGAETVVAWIAVNFLYGRPALDVALATLAGLAYLAPLNFSVGNLLSIYAPKKLDYSSMRRQHPSQMSTLISLGMLIFLVGVGVATFWGARLCWNIWIATLVLLALAGLSFLTYVAVLNRMDSLALERRETLVGALCRA